MRAGSAAKTLGTLLPAASAASPDGICPVFCRWALQPSSQSIESGKIESHSLCARPCVSDACVRVRAAVPVPSARACAQASAHAHMRVRFRACVRARARCGVPVATCKGTVARYKDDCRLNSCRTSRASPCVVCVCVYVCVCVCVCMCVCVCARVYLHV